MLPHPPGCFLNFPLASFCYHYVNSLFYYWYSRHEKISLIPLRSPFDFGIHHILATTDCIPRPSEATRSWNLPLPDCRRWEYSTRLPSVKVLLYPGREVKTQADPRRKSESRYRRQRFWPRFVDLPQEVHSQVCEWESRVPVPTIHPLCLSHRSYGAPGGSCCILLIRPDHVFYGRALPEQLFYRVQSLVYLVPHELLTP